MCSARAGASWTARLISVPRVVDARIEQRIDQVENQGRERDCENEHKHNPLDKKVIGPADRAIERFANARVGEDNLDDDRASDQLAERQGESGRLREKRVAN